MVLGKPLNLVSEERVGTRGIMPARSIAQQQAMAIAEHNPSKLYSRNKSLLKMSHQQLHDFASTSHKGLAYKVAKSFMKRKKKP